MADVMTINYRKNIDILLLEFMQEIYHFEALQARRANILCYMKMLYVSYR